MNFLKKLSAVATLSLILPAEYIFCAPRPILYELKAQQMEEDKILLTWKTPNWDSGRQPTGIYLFRDTKPLENIDSRFPLAILPISSNYYIDTPGDYREYFYAIVAITNPSEESQSLITGQLYYDEELDSLPKNEKDIFIPGINSTAQGIRIQGLQHTAENLAQLQKERQKRMEEGKSYDEGTLREKPLPLMEFPGSTRMDSTEISSGIAEKIQLIASKNGTIPKKILDFYLFPEDSDTRKTKIPVTNLIKKDFAKAGPELLNFLSATEKESPEYYRCKFYIAECSYFSGNFSESTKQFAMLQDMYPKLCLNWVKSSLEMLELPSE